MNLNCRGILLDLSKPKVMAILNMTPDSFYDGANYIKEKDNVLLTNNERVIQKIDELLSLNASIIDVGGMSSRPGAKTIDIEEEWTRIEFALQYIITNYPQRLISVDTMHSEIARRALNMGIHIINDISGGTYDKDMLKVIAEYNAVFCLMHMKGTPENMQQMTNYPEGVAMEVLRYCMDAMKRAKHAGISEIVIDPGFGFSKTLEQNYELLNKLHVLKILDTPILVGLSRKSMIYKLLGHSPKEALNGTSVLHLKALQEGASLLRVHDVKEAKEVIALHEMLCNVK